jgi:hypothetical protein
VSQRTQQLLYNSAPTNQAESALFFQNESKIDRASIDADHYEEIVWLDGVPYRRVASKFIGNTRRGQSTFGGNDSTMMRHPEQLLYDNVTPRRGQSAFVGNDSTTLWHQKQLFLYNNIPSRWGQSTFCGSNFTIVQHPEELLYDDVTSRQGQSSLVGNDSTTSWHQEQLLYDDVPSC